MPSAEAYITTISGQAVLRNRTTLWRWYDAWGPSVTKWEINPYTFPLIDGDNVAGYTISDPPGTVAFSDIIDAGAVTIAADGTDQGGVTLRSSTLGFGFANAWPCYFGIYLSIDDVTKSWLLAGIKYPSASTIAAPGNGIYFRSVDDSALLTFNTANGTDISNTGVATLVNDTPILLEWYFDGSEVKAYVNSTEMMSTPYASDSFPNATMLTPHISLLAGENDTKTMTLYWARAIQIRETS